MGEWARTHSRYFETAGAGWQTDDIESSVSELKGRGVVFEEYDMPGFTTVNSIAAIGPSYAAWFKDSEGNILSIAQMLE